MTASPSLAGCLRRTEQRGSAGDLCLPISHLNGRRAEAREETGAETVAHQLAPDYRTETPFVLLAIVAAVTISAIALISLTSLLVFWLA
jgi:hypothetical protein